MLVKEKVHQAVGILEENGVDCWMTFVRESSMGGEPMLKFLSETDVTWHSAFIVTRSGKTYAIVGELERQSAEDMGVYDEILSFVEGFKEPFLKTMKAINPRSIAVNYSVTSEVADGLSHGMYLTLIELLSEIGFENRVISAEKIVSSLRARKTEYELDRIKQAIRETEEIFAAVHPFIKPGISEKEIAAFMADCVEEAGLELAWGAEHCPAVFTGPDTAGAHYRPTDRRVERGHVLNMDFGVKVDGYCSDMQRTFYVLKEGETVAPPDVLAGFETIVDAIEMARQALKPGVIGRDVDHVARQHIVNQGYAEYPHGLGHQVGLFAHDGTAILGPDWEKYHQKVFLPLEEGMVFTLEPRLTVAGRGVATVEEMVVVTAAGAEFLSTPQTELLLIGN